MGFLKRALESRDATLSNPPEWLITALNGAGRTYTGKSVSVSSSMGLIPFYRGVNILANAFAVAPCKVYRDRRSGKREEARGTRAWELLHDRPNEWMHANEFWSLVSSHIETWGNSFAWKERGGDGRIANLWPLDPGRVQVGIIDGKRVFVIDGKEGEPYGDFDFIHTRGLSRDGVVGYSPVQLAKEELGNQLARQEFKGRFWANDATPGVTLIHPNKLQPDAIDRIRALWDNRHKGVGKARVTAVLAENIKVEQMTMPLSDAQFIEQERYGRTDIALLLGLPAYMLAGDSGGDSLTYSTTEGHALDLLKWTVGPRYVRAQGAFTLDPDLMPSNHFAEFVPEAILRATTTERYRAWAIAPHLTVDEMREMDNREALPGGKGKVLAKAAKAAPAAEKPAEEPPADSDDNGNGETDDQ